MKKVKIQIILSIFLVVAIAFSTNASIWVRMDNNTTEMQSGSVVMMARDVARYATVTSFLNANFDESSKISEGYFRGVQELFVADGNFIGLDNANVIKVGPSQSGITCIDADKVTVFNPDNDIDLYQYELIGHPANATLETNASMKVAPFKIQIFKPTVRGKDPAEVADINGKLNSSVDLIYKQCIQQVKSSPRPEDVGSSIFLLDVRETACTKKKFMIEFNGKMVVGYGNRPKSLRFIFIYDRRSKTCDVKETKGVVG